MSDLFNQAFGAVSGSEWDEIPVEIEEFVTSEKFLGLPPLSEYQYEIIRHGSQIYRLDTLAALYGERKARKRYEETCNEIVLQLGKGSGKDYTSTIICAYIVYLLLCLKDPARYYGKPKGDTIDILNIAVNADQARQVFFVNFKKRITETEWFNGKYAEPTQNGILFDKSIRVFSGHSEREAFEGLNLFVAVLDEIAAFALESPSGDTGKTAQGIYDMYRASVDSRFAEFGKVIMLSFPRFKGDFIQQRYDAVIADKETVMKSMMLKRDPDLPDGFPGNEIKIEWEEDHIIRYEFPRMFALRRPSWDVNPIFDITAPAFVRQAVTNMADFLGRFACMPSTASGGFFKNHEAIDEAFVTVNPVDDDGIFLKSWEPKPDVDYFIHVDLAQKHDYCAVALAHVDSWEEVSIGAVDYKELHPVVQVDAIRHWTPTQEKSVDFADVRNYIIALRRKGFKLKLVTFDRWNSHDTMNILTNEYGIPTELLSVADKHYDDFLSIMYDYRLVGPKDDILIDELKQLQIIKNKIDHPANGTKDLSDATCGAIFNAVAYTPKPVNRVVEIRSVRDHHLRNRREEEQGFKGVIEAPKRQMPPELEQYLGRMRTL